MIKGFDLLYCGFDFEKKVVGTYFIYFSRHIFFQKNNPSHKVGKQIIALFFFLI